MKQKILIATFLLIGLIFLSCSEKSDNVNEDKNPSNDRDKITTDVDNTVQEEMSIPEYENPSSCELEDGTYTATVDYDNQRTGYSATYILDVEVVDCQVVQINFPNGGYIDEDHIYPADLDADGNASVEGENGKTYEVHIDY